MNNNTFKSLFLLLVILIYTSVSYTCNALFVYLNYTFI